MEDIAEKSGTGPASTLDVVPREVEPPDPYDLNGCFPVLRMVVEDIRSETGELHVSLNTGIHAMQTALYFVALRVGRRVVLQQVSPGDKKALGAERAHTTGRRLTKVRFSPAEAHHARRDELSRQLLVTVMADGCHRGLSQRLKSCQEWSPGSSSASSWRPAATSPFKPTASASTSIDAPTTLFTHAMQRARFSIALQSSARIMGCQVRAPASSSHLGHGHQLSSDLGFRNRSFESLPVSPRSARVRSCEEDDLCQGTAILFMHEAFEMTLAGWAPACSAAGPAHAEHVALAVQPLTVTI